MDSSIPSESDQGKEELGAQFSGPLLGRTSPGHLPPGVTPPGVGPPGTGGTAPGSKPPGSNPPGSGQGSSPPTRGPELVLCLSGGGLRATFFHLGVLRYLCDIGQLQRVEHIYAVSGGSILAAHLASRWDDYKNKDTFKSAAEELRALAKRDVRGRIVRTWLLACTAFGLPLFWRPVRRQQLLIREYERFFSQGGRSTKLGVLSPEGRTGRPPDGPRVHLLTTSFRTGSLCKFSGDGLTRLDDPHQQIPFDSPLFDLPLAVAASSAFPPLFPPIEVDAERFGIPRKGFDADVDYLSDGGVSDNLGVGAAMIDFWKDGIPGRGRELLVSDASAVFDWSGRRQSWNIIERAARSSDVLMRLVSDLEVEREQLGVAYSIERARMRRRAWEEKVEHLRTSSDAAERAEGESLLAEEKTQSPWEADKPHYVLRFIRIDGSKVQDIRLGESEYNGFLGQWEPIRPQPAPRPEPSSWAAAMAAMRTDLDRFSVTERESLEMWGYKRGSEEVPPPGRPPGWQPEPIGPEPTKEQFRNLLNGKKRKWRIVEVRNPIGIALAIVLAVLAALVVIGIWQGVLYLGSRLLKWISL